ncbi:MAG: phosphate acyltransferase [Caldilineaceae bacterium]
MKIACAKALADLAKEDVPDSVIRAYGLESLRFGREYIIPKPLDPRVLMWVAPAVAKAGMESGVARINIDLNTYMDQLAGRQGKGVQIMRNLEQKARQDPKRIVFADGDHPNRAQPTRCRARASPRRCCWAIRAWWPSRSTSWGWTLRPRSSALRWPTSTKHYAQEFYERRQRVGITQARARELMRQTNYFGSMMVQQGDADAFISGLTYNYPEVVRPALQVIGAQSGRWVSGVYLMLVQERLFFFTDATVIIDPDAEQLAAIAMSAADFAENFNIEPQVAMLSFSNFGSVRHAEAEKVKEATRLVKELRRTSRSTARCRRTWPWCRNSCSATMPSAR